MKYLSSIAWNLSFMALIGATIFFGSQGKEVAIGTGLIAIVQIICYANDWHPRD